MKRTLPSIAGLFLLALLFLFIPGGCGSQGSTDTAYWGGGGSDIPSGYKVSGKIISPVTLAPIQGMKCTLQAIDGGKAAGVAYTTNTDDQGYYTFSGLENGNYRMTTAKDGNITDNSYFTVTQDMTINQTSVKKDEWATVMGADHPYDASMAYVSAVVDHTGGGTPPVRGAVSSKDPGKDGVAVDLFTSSKGKGSGYQARCYMDAQGKADWTATSTTSTGVAIFYKALPTDTYTMTASKANHAFDDVTGIAPVKGEFTNYMMFSKENSAGLTAAIERVLAMRPIKGMCYSPNPDAFSSGQNPWPDADFCNEDFKQMWGPTGRDDIGKLKEIGVTFLHLYDWSRQGTEGYWNGKRDHTSFFKYVEEKQLKMAYPISAYFVSRAHGSLDVDTWKFDEATMAGYMKEFVADAYPGGKHRPCVTMFALGNEFDLGQASGWNQQNAEKVASLIEKIVNAENDAKIPEEEKLAFTAPVSTATKPVWYSGPAEEECKIALRELRNELKKKNLDSIWKTRFIVSINPFQMADGLKSRIETQYPAMLKNLNDNEEMYYCFFECGWPEFDDVEKQGRIYDEQLSTILPYANDTAKYFLGPCVLEAVNVKTKGTPDGTHGIYRVLAPGGLGQGKTAGGELYPLDSWEAKPNYTSVSKNFLP